MLSLLRHCWSLVTGGSRARSVSLVIDLVALAALDLAQLICLHRLIDGLGGSITAPVAGLVATALIAGGWLKHLLMKVHLAFAAYTVDYTDEVLARLHGADLLEFEGLDRAEFESTLRIDLEQFRRFAHGFVEVLRGLLVGAAYLGYVIMLSPSAALVIYGWLFAMGLTSAMWARRWRAQSKRGYAARDAFVGLAYAIYDGAREIGLHRQRSDRLWATIEGQGQRFREIELTGRRLFASNSARASLTLPGLLGVIAFVVPLVMVGGDVAASGLLAIGLLSMRYVMLIIRGTNSALTTQPIYERLQRLLAQLPGARVEASASPIALAEGIALRGVRFRYPATAARPGFELGPIDVDLRPGRATFVIGHNGSGKSTLLKGLCGLYPLSAGEVKVDGVSARTTTAAYRALFAVAFAQPIIHRRLYGLDADPDRVQQLIDEMGLTDKVRYADGAFDTVELSTGQRKRLSLILCLLQDRPVIVFDEWAADQDPGFRARFYEVVVPRLRADGKALLVISHDDQFFDVADDTLALAHGRVLSR